MNTMLSSLWRYRILLVTCLAVTSAPAHECTAREYPDPESADQDPDFRIQGEYVGPDRAMQVVATGQGLFTAVVYEGGLPGAGWQKEPPRRIDVDAETVLQLVESMEMERVDRTSPTLGAPPPPGATLLFDGSQQSIDAHWREDARLDESGLLMPGATTRAEFNDYTLHVEFRTPYDPTASGQGRGNSGVYHQGRYETQILDSFGSEGQSTETGGIYTVRAPDLNMCLPPLVWQTYDVDFTAARFDAEGNKVSPPRMTVRLNGIVVQNDIPVPHATRAAPREEGPSAGPVYLQDHGNQVRFRNVWILPRDSEREARRPLVPGFERFYASASHLDPAEGGHVLLANLGCRNCHAGEDHVWASATGPRLGDVADRIRPDHLVRWIADPHAVKPGTTMPDALHGRTSEERQHAAEAIASFLILRSQSDEWRDRAGDSQAAARGESLFHRIGCAACHAPRDGTPAPSATSVPLGPLEEKYTLDSLARFLVDPHAVRPDGRMPRLVSDAAEARDIATYLLRDVVVVPGAGRFSRSVYRGRWEKIPDFSSLEPVATGEIVDELTFEGVGALDYFGAVYEAYLPITEASRYRFFLGSDDGSRLVLDGREVVRVEGTHPYQVQEQEVDLDAGVHHVRVEYFEFNGEEQLTLEIEGGEFGRSAIAPLVTQDPGGAIDRELVPQTFVPDKALVTQGSELFSSLGCIRCHAIDDAAGSASVASQPTMATAPPLDKLSIEEGCLAGAVPLEAPDFELSDSQIRSVRLALTALREQAPVATDPETHVRMTMVAANCTACHSRDTLGGPEPARDAVFRTTTQEMGNEGRVPPPLDGVGDKLADRYLTAILEHGANDRPYMHTRMPGFGYDALRRFHEALVDADRPGDSAPATVDATERHLQADGRTLVGNDGLACIKCHTFNGQGASGIQALDMVKMTDRLRRDWFERYLHDPQRYRPGTRMPASFPDGRSVLTTIADGDPAYQIHAMWTYLSAGDRAKPPAGLTPGAIELKPEERPILYRNFLAGLHPGGIAVGYPERLNLAWDPQVMALRRLWHNQFLDASLHWRGRGPGDLAPLGDVVVEFESSAPLAEMTDVDGEWPRETNRKNGYAFQGYHLDTLGRPTFRYRVGQASVEDFVEPVAGDDGRPGSFRRQLTIRTGDQPLVFRAASGTIRPVEDDWYSIDDRVRVRIDGADVRLIQAGDHQELRATVPAGSTTILNQHIQW